MSGDNSLVLYRFFDDKDRLLYIGKSIKVWHRFVTHQRAGVFYPEAAKVTLQRGFGCHDELLAAERDAIRAEQPEYNEVYKNPPSWEQDPISGCFCGPRRKRDCSCGDREVIDIDIVATFVRGITTAPHVCCGCPKKTS